MIDFEKMKQIDVMENAKKALKYLDDEVVGCEEQERLIEDLVADFIASKKGLCCLLEGEPNCGRESVLRKVLRHRHIDLRVINAGYLAADPSIQESLAREEDEGYSVFLVRDADELLTAHQQEFLYTIVDKATTYAWLVFFSISRHNFSQNLEKRGNSRMPRIRVTFEPSLKFEDYCTHFQQLMAPKNSGCENAQFYMQLVRAVDVKTWLKPIFERYNYDVLKMIAAQLLMRIAHFCDIDNFKPFNEEELLRILEETIDFAISGNNRRIQLLEDQTLKSQCVFLCVHRLVMNKNVDGPLLTPKTSYRTVFLEYKKLVNQYYSILNVTSDVYIFREIDHLVEMGLLKADKSTNVTNISFRKVWLDVDSLTVAKSIPTLQLPTKVRDFFATVLK